MSKKEENETDKALNEGFEKLSKPEKTFLSIAVLIAIVSWFAIIPVFIFTIDGNFKGSFIALAIAFVYSYISAGAILVNKVIGYLTYQIGIILSFVLFILYQIFGTPAEVMLNTQYVWLTGALAFSIPALLWRVKFNEKLIKFNKKLDEE